MSVKAFSEKLGKDWKEIFKAQELTILNQKNIKSNLGPDRLFSSDADLVVFGSIARNECTLGSDADWTLLIDGQAGVDYSGSLLLIEKAITKSGLGKPGTTEMFAQATISHDLIKHIGGEFDTNRNLSKRLLLLLESDKITFDDSEAMQGTAHDRVVRGIIQQYIDNDSGFAASSGKENVPRFFLNDIVRFWRTMCVDFAYKQREQKGNKWAIRNIKLRMSRKLIFVKGFLMCFKFYKSLLDREQIKEELRRSVDEKPLDFVVSVFSDLGIAEIHIVKLLDSYDKYLGMLNDKHFREHLTEMEMHKAYGDPQFEEARENSHDFQSILNKMFFEEDSKLKEFTLKYGIF